MLRETMVVGGKGVGVEKEGLFFSIIIKTEYFKISFLGVNSVFKIYNNSINYIFMSIILSA